MFESRKPGAPATKKHHKSEFLLSDSMSNCRSEVSACHMMFPLALDDFGIVTGHLITKVSCALAHSMARIKFSEETSAFEVTKSTALRHEGSVLTSSGVSSFQELIISRVKGLPAPRCAT